MREVRLQTKKGRELHGSMELLRAREREGEKKERGGKLLGEGGRG